MQSFYIYFSIVSYTKTLTNSETLIQSQYTKYKYNRKLASLSKLMEFLQVKVSEKP